MENLGLQEGKMIAIIKGGNYGLFVGFLDLCTEE